MPKTSKTLQNKQRGGSASKVGKSSIARSRQRSGSSKRHFSLPRWLVRTFFVAMVILVGVLAYDVMYVQHLAQVNATTLPVQASVSPSTIVIGNGTTLSWSATNSKICHIYGYGVAATLKPKGTMYISNLTSSQTYTVTCLFGLSYVTTKTTVTVIPKIPAPAGYSKLVFDDTFKGTTLDSSKWITQMITSGGLWDDEGRLTMPYSAVGDQGQFNAEYGNPDQVVINNGATLNATRDTSYPGYTWKAGYLTTHGKFSFDHGFAQFRARMPDSRTGAWATFWFLEGGGEIDLTESGFTHCGSTVINMCFASNLNTTGNSQVFHNVGIDMSTGYHIYGMRYVPGKLVAMYLDGKLWASYTKNVPTGKMIIVMTETMATAATANWHTVTSSATPSPVTPPFSILEAQIWQ